MKAIWTLLTLLALVGLSYGLTMAPKTQEPITPYRSPGAEAAMMAMLFAVPPANRKKKASQ